VEIAYAVGMRGNEQGNERDREWAGLCADCRHARRVESARGSRFFLCGRAVSDPSFLKYPRLPVLACRGYEGEERGT
jgi:hypothetical protein